MGSATLGSEFARASDPNANQHCFRGSYTMLPVPYNVYGAYSLCNNLAIVCNWILLVPS